ncbi:zinc-binding dehydrogenase [Cohnella zeiphila]|uniref:Zinc-binding dehydrogenase n=1 Tax=Cohnella zeiphila TaxID=2761120 RepID=A0A7X0VZR2_9BACL|nr:zinc-binding dehydrogenase [Cohnella zeiphila]MBB6736030.1 zinc-binding dehydrogenase [Cohnella zeiphila]
MMEPLNCTLGAVERVRGMAGARVVVFGSGPAGLLFVQLAKAYGAAAVTLVGTNEPSLALGSRLGADLTLNVHSRPLPEPLEPDSFDVAIEAAGSADAVRDCLRSVAGGGTVVLYGLNGEGNPTIDSDRIVGKDLTVVTCISAPLLWGKCIELVRFGKVNVKDIVTEKASLEDGAALVNAMAEGTWGTVKLMLLHDS